MFLPGLPVVWFNENMVEGKPCCVSAGRCIWLSRVEGAQCLPAESGGCVLVGTLARPPRHYESG